MRRDGSPVTENNPVPAIEKQTLTRANDQENHRPLFRFYIPPPRPSSYQPGRPVR